MSCPPEMVQKYKKLFDGAEIRQGRESSVARMCDMICKGKPIYEVIQHATGIPWFVIGAIHGMESSFNFKTHLHNGDPLTEKTKNVPAGRPLTPPKNGKYYTFEESATDALRMKPPIGPMLIENILYWLEKYNGMGYQRRNLNSPYLWSFSNQYECGKYVRDGKFDPKAISAQCGCAIAIKELMNRGIIII